MKLREYPLHPHPRQGAGPLAAIVVTISSDGDGALACTWRLHGDPAGLRLPPPAPACHTHGLWRHTCVEIFLDPGAPPVYHEYNLAPSGAWAAWRFRDRRAGMAPMTPRRAPEVHTRILDGECRICTRIWPKSPPRRLGLAAVIEDRLGRLSHWALVHPADEPDFHHPDARMLEPAP